LAKNNYLIILYSDVPKANSPKSGVWETLIMSEENIKTPQEKKYLTRLETFLDVVYALIFFQMLQYLPQSEGMEWVGKPLGLLQPLVDNPVEVLRIIIGLGITLLYWNFNNKLLGPLIRTDFKHAILTLLQLVFVCFFLYFAISDPALAGGASSPALQSVMLSIAGFLGVWGWSYARKHKLVDGSISEKENARTARRGLIEPITALLTTPLAWLGPVVWTISWIVIPFILSRLIRNKT